MFDESGFTRRLTAVIGLYKRKTHAAETAGVTTQTLRKYVDGSSEGAFSKVAKMAMRQGVSLEWLATGGGEMLTKDRDKSEPVSNGDEVNMEALEHAIEMAEDGIKTMKRRFTTSQKAEMIRLMYIMFSEASEDGKVDKNVVVEMFKYLGKA